MYSKLEITATMELLSGLHIGGSSEFSAIGTVDSPVVRDTYSDQPMIPGSSIKGKMRSLLSRQYCSEQGKLFVAHDQDDERILRLFGSAKMKEGRIRASRLIFSDSYVSNADELKSMGVPLTEVKFENTINRISAVANPRQIERTVRGAKYQLRIVYNLEDATQCTEDMETLRDGFELLQYDYLGGHGSRGYGRVRFTDMKVRCVVGDCGQEQVNAFNGILKEAENEI